MPIGRSALAVAGAPPGRIVAGMTIESMQEPIRDGDGATILGPRNVAVERENPDLLTPPVTDSGTIPNLKYSFAAAHNRLLPGGWAREVTTRELPIATELAGVNMRLEPHAVREMHWHKEAEWGYMLAGHARVTAIDEQGRSFVDDVGEGDIWNFPAVSPTRSRPSATAASSCSCSTTARSRRTRRS